MNDDAAPVEEPAAEPEHNPNVIYDVRPATTDLEIDAFDLILGFLTFPVVLFITMFATSGMTEMLKVKSRRRRFFLISLAVEIVILGAILAAVMS